MHKGIGQASALLGFLLLTFAFQNFTTLPSSFGDPGVTYVQDSTLPSNCGYPANDDSRIFCDATVSQTVLKTILARQKVWFFNNSSNWVRLDRVTADERGDSNWSEFCVNIGLQSMGDFRGDRSISDFPGQRRMGRGEVGCVVKAKGYTLFDPLHWDNGYGTGLSVAPGEKVLIGKNGSANSSAIDYVVNFSSQTVGGLVSIRQPRLDPFEIPCNDEDQFSGWEPWKNESGKTIVLTGVRTYAASGPESKSVDTACLAILASDGGVRLNQCDARFTSGQHTLFASAIRVLPGETLVARAKHRCSKGKSWNWAAYFLSHYDARP